MCVVDLMYAACTARRDPRRALVFSVIRIKNTVITTWSSLLGLMQWRLEREQACTFIPSALQSACAAASCLTVASVRTLSAEIFQPTAACEGLSGEEA